MVLHLAPRQAGDQLVREAHALRRAERVACAVAVVFVQRLVVGVLREFLDGEEATEGGNGACGAGDGGEGAEVEEGDDVRLGQVEGQVAGDAGLDGGHEDVGPVGLSGGGDVAVGAVFEGCAEVVVQGVVLAGVFGDGEDGVGVG